MTVADELRRAAAKIRATAEGTTHTPWTVELLGQGTNHPGYPQRITNHDETVIAETWVDPEYRPADAEHIAMWHPGVTAHIATWLDRIAADMDANPGIPTIGWDEAIAIARAVNGSAR